MFKGVIMKHPGGTGFDWRGGESEEGERHPDSFTEGQQERGPIQTGGLGKNSS